MTRDTARAIVRKDRALIIVPDPLRLMVEDSRGDEVRNLELHLSLQDYETLARQMPGPVREFMDWVISLDDPDPESSGYQDRRTITMTEIIRRARTALNITE